MAHRPTQAEQYTDEDGAPAWDCPECGHPYSSATAAQMCCQD